MDDRCTSCGNTLISCADPSASDPVAVAVRSEGTAAAARTSTIRPTCRSSSCAGSKSEALLDLTCINHRLANLRKHRQHSEFGAFCPVFRTHGCRSCSGEGECQQEPDVAPCVAHPHEPLQGSCAANEVWSYGSATQVHLEKYVRVRKQLKPYIAELAGNVSKSGVPTMRPLWYEFPDDDHCRGVNDQYLLGPLLLVVPVMHNRLQNLSFQYELAG